jgi:PqqD family protein of HPr-rel-A system
MAAPVYAADPAELRRSGELESLAILYHRPSGMTHMLAPPAPQILDALGEGPASAAEVARRLAATFELQGEDPPSAVAAGLAELEAAGLVWRP